jgi:tyrosine-protein phosphatase YwqE
MVHDIASDAHDTDNRGPDMRVGLEAAERLLPGSHALADWLTVDVPGAVISGASVPPRPAARFAPTRRRKLLAGRLLSRATRR